MPQTNWLSRRTIQIMYDYPFYQVGCQMVIKTTMADNMIVLRIMHAVGFDLHWSSGSAVATRTASSARSRKSSGKQSRYNINRKRPLAVHP